MRNKKIYHSIVYAIFFPLAWIGFATPRNLLGRAYEEGYVLKKNYEKAVYWYEKAAEKELLEALFNIARMHDRGVGGDSYTAVNFYRRAAEAGHSLSQVALGAILLEGRCVKKNPREAIFWYRKAEKQGCAYAFYSLASAFYYGLGVEEDKDDAFRYCLAAASAGVEEAKQSLLAFYEEGIGREEDRKYAVEFLSQ